MQAQSEYESTLKAEITAREKLNDEKAELTKLKNKLASENRYLRKMLRTYLYPAVADEILLRENVLKEVNTETTDTAVKDMTEQGNRMKE